MIVSENTHQHLSDYNQFLFEKIFEVNIKQNLSSEKDRISSNCIYDYAHSYIGKDF